jgi:hypothetical protein
MLAIENSPREPSVSSICTSLSYFLPSRSMASIFNPLGVILHRHQLSCKIEVEGLARC